MDRTALYNAIIAYTENTSSDFAAQLPVFVQQAEQRIFNSIQFPSLRKNVTGYTTANNKYLQCPSDFLSVYSMAAIDASGNYEYLLDKDVNFIRQAYPNPNDDKAIPRYYALFGPRSDDEKELSFILGPTPDATYTIELHYFYYPESITTSPTTRTWLGDNFDSVLFYGSLVEAATYMKQEQDLVALYNQKYTEALALAKRLGDGLERSDAYRSGQARVAPLPQNNGVK
jgi:hypothetical protein